MKVSRRWMRQHIKDLRNYILALETELDEVIAENDALRKAH